MERESARRTLPSQLRLRSVLRRKGASATEVEVVAVPVRLMLGSVVSYVFVFEPVDVDAVPGLARSRSGFPPSRSSPSAWSCMNDVRAVVKESESAFAAVGCPLLRTLVKDRVRGSVGVCHPEPFPSVLSVGLPSGDLNGLAVAALRIAVDRMEILRPRPVELEDRLDHVRSLRVEPVRSDLSGDTLPFELGLERRGGRPSTASCQSPGT